MPLKLSEGHLRGMKNSSQSDFLKLKLSFFCMRRSLCRARVAYHSALIPVNRTSKEIGLATKVGWLKSEVWDCFWI